MSGNCSVRVPTLKRPADVNDPATRSVIIGFIADMVEDLLTDPRWADRISGGDIERAAAIVRQPTCDARKLPYMLLGDVTNRIYLAVQDLRLTREERHEFLRSWLVDV